METRSNQLSEADAYEMRSKRQQGISSENKLLMCEKAASTVDNRLCSVRIRFRNQDR